MYVCTYVCTYVYVSPVSALFVRRRPTHAIRRAGLASVVEAQGKREEKRAKGGVDQGTSQGKEGMERIYICVCVYVYVYTAVPGPAAGESDVGSSGAGQAGAIETQNAERSAL